MIEVSSDTFIKLKRCKKGILSYAVFKDGRLFAFTDFGFRSVKTSGDVVEQSFELSRITEVPDKHTMVKFASDLSSIEMQCGGVTCEVPAHIVPYKYSVDTVVLSDVVKLPDDFAQQFKKCCVCNNSEIRPALKGVGVLEDCLVATDACIYFEEKMNLFEIVAAFDRAVETYESSGFVFSVNPGGSRFVIPFFVSKYLSDYNAVRFAASEDGSVFYIVFCNGDEDELYVALDSYLRIPILNRLKQNEYRDFFELSKSDTEKLRDYLVQTKATNQLDFVSNDGLLYISVGRVSGHNVFKTNIKTFYDGSVYLIAENFVKILPIHDVTIATDGVVCRFSCGPNDNRWLAFAAFPQDEEGNDKVTEVDFSSAVSFDLGINEAENSSVLQWF